jgi:hypothetical protein
MFRFELLPDDLDVDPAAAFRSREWPKYLGWGLTQIAEKQKTGELPPPIPLTASPYSPLIYTGEQLIMIHRQRLASAKARQGNEALKHPGFSEETARTARQKQLNARKKLTKETK